MDYIVHEFNRRLGDFERCEIQEHFYNNSKEVYNETRLRMAQQAFEKLNKVESGKRDTYTSLAAKFFKIPYDEVTQEQRNYIKQRAFMYVYSKRNF